MDQLNHRDYYRTRAVYSRDLAGRAADPAIAAIHTELALRYEFLAARPEPRDDAAAGAQAA